MIDEDGMLFEPCFMSDEKGVIRWSHLSPVGVNPGAEGLLDVLESLSEKRKEAA